VEVIHLLGSVMGLALVSGINLYATILTVGLGIQFGFIHLPPELSALSVLGHPYVLMAASITYTLEFFADKIPWVDSLWDTFHTFIRPVGGALLGMKAVGAVDPVIELSVMLLCGGVAFLSHSAKASTRFVANHSPEPFTNIALSFGEDISVITGTWAALEYPVTMFVVTILFIAGFIFWAPKIFRLLRVEMLAILSLFQTFFDRNDISDDSILSDEIPDDLYAQIQADTAPEEKAFCIRCVSGKGIETGRNQIGFLYMAGDRLSFITRKNFHIRKTHFDIFRIMEPAFYKKRLLDRLVFSYGQNRICLLMFKNSQNKGQRIAEILETVRGT